MTEKISRRDFLKLIGVVGGVIMFAPLKFRNVLGTNENSTNTTDVPAADSNAGPDGL